MQKILSLWKNTSKSGKTYYTGKLGELPVIVFENNNKTNEKQPDLTIYAKEEVKKEQPKKQDNTTIYTKDIGIDFDTNDNFLE